MSQDELINSDHLIGAIPSLDANLYVESCPTCTKVFYRPKNLGREHVKIYWDELVASARANCQWCTILWKRFRTDDKIIKTIARFGSSLQQVFLEFNLYGKHVGGDWEVLGEIEGLSCMVTLTPDALKITSETFTMAKLPDDHPIDISTPAFKLPMATSSPSCRILASQWIDNCTQNHKKCRTDKMKWLPTRLVDVGINDGIIRLIETQELSKKEEYPSYFALSHRWGATFGKLIQLLNSNRSAWMQHIPIDQIPATFLDSIKFTRDMNISYIWIDSLCIIQDSKEDWSNEARFMDRVYVQSLCNIAASHASGHREAASYESSRREAASHASSHGEEEEEEEDDDENLNIRLFYTRTRNDFNAFSSVDKLVTIYQHQGFYRLSPSSNRLIGYYLPALYERAWVLQEQRLSPRTIHFSKQLYWECREQMSSEIFPAEVCQPPTCKRDLHNFDENVLPKDWRSGLQELKYSYWYETLSYYLRCSLTYPSDRLVAIGAIAREYQTELKDIYLAGLWKKELPFCLLWVLFGTTSREQFPTKPETYRCPSWSWAFMDISYPTQLHIFQNGSENIALVCIVEAKVSSQPERAYTEYLAGFIKLQGKIFSIGFENAHKWLFADDKGVFLPYSGTFQIKSWLDVEIHRSDSSRLYLLPISISSDPVWDVYQRVNCLVLKDISVGSAEFERVGVLTFGYNENHPPLDNDPQLRLIGDFASAVDPLAQHLDTITLL